MAKKSQNSPPTSNGNDIKTAFERAENGREIKAIEKHLRDETQILEVETGTINADPLKPEQLTPEERKLYSRLPKAKQESYLAHLAEVRADKAGEDKERTPEPIEQATAMPEVLPVTESDESGAASPEPTQKHRENSQSEVMRKGLREEFQTLYSNGRGVPPGVFARYFSLINKLRDLKWGADETEQEEIAAEIESFMAEQRAAAEPRKPEPPMIPNPEEAIDKEHVREILGGNEGTPLEWREKLRGLIMGMEKRVMGSERTERLNAYLAECSKDLGEKAKEYGPKTVELIGSLSEKYNKLNWKTKLVVAGGLVAGVSLTSAAFPIVSGILGGALYGQRVIGSIGFAMNRRKALDAKIAADPNHWLAGKSERMKNTYATTLAAVYMGSTAFAVHEGVEALNALGMNEWLGSMLGHKPEGESPAVTTAPTAAGVITQEIWEKLQEKGLDPNQYEEGSDLRRLLEDNAAAINEIVAQAAAPDAAPITAEIPTPEVAAPEVPQAAAAAAAGEVAAAAPTPEMPSVEAVKGHGYEYMMKQLWEQMHDPEKHFIPPSNLDPTSDLGRLLEVKPGDESGINQLVHKLAEENQFYKPDGTSVRIDLGSKMTFDAEGNIWRDDDIIAPADAPVTPAYHPEAPAPHVETPASHAAPTSTIEDAATSDAANALEQPTAPLAHDSSVVHDSQGQAVLDSQGNPIHTGSYETPSQSPDHFTQEQDVTMRPEIISDTPTFLTKIDGVLINPDVPAIYQAQMPTGETYLAAYGGSDEARFKFIDDYLMRPENQGKSVRFAHEVPSILGTQIKVGEIGTSTTAGKTSWLLDFFKKPIPPPSPDTFLRRLSQ